MHESVYDETGACENVCMGVVSIQISAGCVVIQKRYGGMPYIKNMRACCHFKATRDVSESKIFQSGARRTAIQNIRKRRETRRTPKIQSGTGMWCTPEVAREYMLCFLFIALNYYFFPSSVSNRIHHFLSFRIILG